MPFDASLPDEVAPGEATAFRCKHFSIADGARCERIYDHGGAHMYGPFKEQCRSTHRVPQLVMTDDWVQRCELPPGHKGQHSSRRYAWDQDPAFVPADAETAAPKCDGCDHAPHGNEPCPGCPCGHPVPEPESRYCGANGECRDPLKRCGLKCRREFPQCRAQFHGGSEGYRCQLHEGHSEPHTNKIPDEGTFNWDDSVAVYPTEPEAPECSACGGNDPETCPFCAQRAVLNNEQVAGGHRIGSPRRPPYAVAYALASGELYEVALPGDAVATVEHGVLKISHPQGVAHIIQVKPMGDQ